MLAIHKVQLSTASLIANTRTEGTSGNYLNMYPAHKRSYKLILLVFCLLYLVSCSSKLFQKSSNNQTKVNHFKVVGYLNSNNLDKIDLIDLTALTHLDLAFANPDHNGKLIFNRDQKLAEIIKKAHKAGVKVFISIAGGGIDDELASNWLSVLLPENRKFFIQELIQFVLQNNLDGVDVDIESNLLPTIGTLYAPFVIELKDALKSKNKGISAALNVSDLHEAISQEALNAYDFINVMVYDKTGPWRPDDVGPHSPYSYAEEALAYWTKIRKIPAQKLTLGVPFYGYDFDKIRSVTYRELVEMDSANAYQDQFRTIYYNGIPTIIKKTQLALKSFGGIMIWELTQDTQDDNSLLKSIKKTIKSNS